jgi:hypothetical protein
MRAACTFSTIVTSMREAENKFNGIALPQQNIYQLHYYCHQVIHLEDERRKAFNVARDYYCTGINLRL